MVCQIVITTKKINKADKASWKCHYYLFVGEWFAVSFGAMTREFSLSEDEGDKRAGHVSMWEKSMPTEVIASSQDMRDEHF